ncbi:hypothetical protein LX36DRAFT_49646 [Colletotrichum falcatum]|nr:hypothetical protein LX36DRAFT_49646 [Colletotrichum falcatum]
MQNLAENPRVSGCSPSFFVGRSPVVLTPCEYANCKILFWRTTISLRTPGPWALGYYYRPFRFKSLATMPWSLSSHRAPSFDRSTWFSSYVPGLHFQPQGPFSRLCHNSSGFSPRFCWRQRFPGLVTPVVDSTFPCALITVSEHEPRRSRICGYLGVVR